MDFVVPVDEPGTKTIIHGKSQGFLGLPVRHSVEFLEQSGKHEHGMTIALRPTAAELEALNKGAAVYVQFLCLDLPPPLKAYLGPINEGVQEDG